MRKKTVTLIELTIILVIISILVALGGSFFYKGIQEKREKNAQGILSIVLEAENDFYNFRGRYTTDWDNLDIERPPADDYYNYTICSAEPLCIEAQPQRSNYQAFHINESGKVENGSCPEAE